MSESDVTTLLQSISIGTVISWVAVIVAIFGAISAATVKAYKCFEKYKKVKDKDAKIEKMVEEHDKNFKTIESQISELKEQICSQLTCVQNELDEQRKTKITELRHSITVSGERALSDGEMTIREWRSLHEMGDTYINRYGQNSYVASLLKKVDREVHVIGKLDEHGNDVEE